MCAGACCYFRTSKPHSGTLCAAIYVYPKEKNVFLMFIAINLVSIDIQIMFDKSRKKRKDCMSPIE